MEFLSFFLVSVSNAQIPSHSSENVGSVWSVTEPLGKTREIAFTTDEGTWMSVFLLSNPAILCGKRVSLCLSLCVTVGIVALEFLSFNGQGAAITNQGQIII